MKIEVMTTIKGEGGEIYMKGSVYSSPNIPPTLLGEMGSGSRIIKVIELDPVSSPVVVETVAVVPPPVLAHEEEPPEPPPVVNPPVAKSHATSRKRIAR